MKLWKKILLVLFCVLLLAQIPFIYNRYQFGNLHDKINQLQNQKAGLPNQNYNDYKGVIHVHTFLGGHSTGTFEELILGAKANNLDFVVMTEHTSEVFDTAAASLQGVQQGILFVSGNELNTNDGNRFLLINSLPDAHSFNKQTAAEFLEKAHSNGKLAFVTYPEKFKSWDAHFDGIEVFSLHTNAKQMNPALFFFDALWSYRAYPELVLAKYFARPDENLKKFDEIAVRRKLTLFAGNDSHSNIGFHVGDDANNKLINFKFDDYETVLHLARTHVLLEKDKQLTQENLLDALKNGHAFIGFDVLSGTEGFLFSAENDAESRIMGDEISLQTGVRLKANAPQNARFVIFKNGEKVFESEATAEAIFEVKETGAYRVEVYLDALGSPFDTMPWIISNPIYVR
ncbi:MAG TPA: hypothetical protein VK892_03810 [Pyrinomonadaceae bacterium]|nr:hypothetical protein [Pyrinomonadaceae bacterium]